MLRDHRRPKQNAANDILKECYGSVDFKEGVSAFIKRESKVRKAPSK
jgi:hypothetical protein